MRKSEFGKVKTNYRGDRERRGATLSELCISIPKIFYDAQGSLVWNFESGTLDAADRPRFALCGGVRPWHTLALMALVVASQLPARERPQNICPTSVSAKGRSFYVDSRHGKDTNPGTSSDKPWRTLDRVNRTVFHAGDHILLKSGSTWTGQLWPKGSGVEGSPITVDMYGGGVKPAIHGDGRVHDAVLLKKQEYWDQEPTRPGSDATN